MTSATLAPVSALAVYPHIYPKLSYKPDDVQPVSIGAIMHHGLAVGPAVPAEVKTLADFLKWAKANPDKAMYGTPGAGSMPHLLGALLGQGERGRLRPCSVRGWGDVVAGLGRHCRMTEKVKSDPLIFKGFFSNLVNDHVPSDTDSEKNRDPCQEK